MAAQFVLMQIKAGKAKRILRLLKSTCLSLALENSGPKSGQAFATDV